MRGFKGAEEAADRAFALLQRRGFHADAAMCLHRGNIDTIRESVRHLASLGVSSLKINRIQELGEWANAAQNVALSEDESLQAYLDYIPQYFEDGAPLMITLDGAFRYDRDEPHKIAMDFMRPCAADAKSEKRLSCGVLRSGMYIGPDGSVCPCMTMADCRIKDWPNIFETPLREILGDTLFMKRCSVTVGQVRDGNDRCRSCAWIEKCSGGCRAAAIAVSDNYFAPEPSHCNFFEHGWYERFVTAEQEALKTFLAFHPELTEETAGMREKKDDLCQL